MKKKCPYLSPALNCMSTGEGHVGCFNHEYHKECEHRVFADERMGDKKPKTEKENPKSKLVGIKNQRIV